VRKCAYLKSGETRGDSVCTAITLSGNGSACAEVRYLRYFFFFWLFLYLIETVKEKEIVAREVEDVDRNDVRLLYFGPCSPQ
jgi:hypothetical protein